MKKLTYMFLAAMLGFVLATNAAIKPVRAIDFVAYLGVAIPDGQIDGTIGTEWDDAGYFTNVAIDPDAGAAEVWAKHDGTYLYMAVRFDADSIDPWLTLQLGTTGCMDATADVAIFGHSTLADNGYSDAFFQFPSVVADTTQDGVGAIGVVVPTQLITVELKKPLNSGDITGNDIAWTANNQYQLVIAWDSNGGGSTGGGIDHTGGTTPTARGILIDPAVIPEFPGFIPVIILIRKAVPKPTTTKKL